MNKKRILFIYLSIGIFLIFIIQNVFSISCDEINLKTLEISKVTFYTNDPDTFLTYLGDNKNELSDYIASSFDHKFSFMILFFDHLPEEDCVAKITKLKDIPIGIYLIFNSKNGKYKFYGYFGDLSVKLFFNDLLTKTMKNVNDLVDSLNLAEKEKVTFYETLRVGLMFQYELLKANLNIINALKVSTIHLKEKGIVVYFDAPEYFKETLEEIGWYYSQNTVDSINVFCPPVEEKKISFISMTHSSDYHTFDVYCANINPLREQTLKILYYLHKSLIIKYVMQGKIKNLILLPFPLINYVNYEKIKSDLFTKDYFIYYYQTLDEAKQLCLDAKDKLNKCYIVRFDQLKARFERLDKAYTIITLPFLFNEQLNLLDSYRLFESKLPQLDIEDYPLYYQFFILAGVQDYINALYSKRRAKYFSQLNFELQNKIKEKPHTYRNLLRKELQNKINSYYHLKLDLSYKPSLREFLSLSYKKQKCKIYGNSNDFSDLYYSIAQCLFNTLKSNFIIGSKLNDELIKYMNDEFKDYNVYSISLEDLSNDRFKIIYEDWVKRFGMIKVNGEEKQMYDVLMNVFDDVSAHGSYLWKKYFLNTSTFLSYLFSAGIIDERNVDYKALDWREMKEKKIKHIILRIKTTLDNLFNEVEKLKNPESKYDNVILGIYSEDRTIYRKKHICGFIKNHLTYFNTLIAEYFNGNSDEFVNFVCENNNVFEMIYFASKHFGISPLFMLALISVESQGNAEAGHSSYGLMQLSFWAKKFNVIYAYKENNVWHYVYDLRTYPPINILSGVMFFEKEDLNYACYNGKCWLDLALYMYNYGRASNIVKCREYDNFFDRWMCVLKVVYYYTQKGGIYEDYIKEGNCYLKYRPVYYDTSKRDFSNMMFASNILYEKNHIIKMKYYEVCNGKEKPPKILDNFDISEVKNILTQLFKYSYQKKRYIETPVYETGQYATKILITYYIFKMLGIDESDFNRFYFGLKQLKDDLDSHQYNRTIIYKMLKTLE